ncbi:hypothetical protein DERF_008064 [Dermatophagoides farinae]|uniref:Uncharacterized protein n=1 Tax=Dermatophagoides farinae TaxID=6954 RepID=A0A922I2L9_DERFA|nr:hypothetical protein DERF_008064 [Dermatophagoides farinae]
MTELILHLRLPTTGNNVTTIVLCSHFFIIIKSVNVQSDDVLFFLGDLSLFYGLVFFSHKSSLALCFKCKVVKQRKK